MSARSVLLELLEKERPIQSEQVEISDKQLKRLEIICRLFDLAAFDEQRQLNSIEWQKQIESSSSMSSSNNNNNQLVTHHQQNDEEQTSLLIDDENFERFLGRKDLFRSYQTYFNRLLFKVGSSKQKLLQIILPTLFQDPIARSFHCVILIALALKVDSENLLIDSLASWCVSFKSLGKISEAGIDESNLPRPVDIISSLKETHKIYKWYKSNQNFQQNLDVLLKKESNLLNTYDLLQVNLETVDDCLQEISELVLALFMSNPQNETLKSLFYATSSFRYLMTQCDFPLKSRPQALRYWMRAIVAAYVLEKQPELQNSVGITSLTTSVLAPNWDQIKSFACSSLDHEIISIVDTCWNEFQFSGIDAYRSIASNSIRTKVGWQKQLGMTLSKFLPFSFSSSSNELSTMTNTENNALISFSLGSLELKIKPKTILLSAASLMFLFALIRLRKAH